MAINPESSKTEGEAARKSLARRIADECTRRGFSVDGTGTVFIPKYLARDRGKVDEYLRELCSTAKEAASRLLDQNPSGYAFHPVIKYSGRSSLIAFLELE